MKNTNTSDLPAQELMTPNQTLAERLHEKAGSAHYRTLRDLLNEAADALDSAKTQLAEAQKQQVADVNRIEVLQKQRSELKEQLATKDAEIERLNEKIQRVLALPSFVEPTPQTVLAKNILAEEQIGNCDSPFVHRDSFVPKMDLLKDCLSFINRGKPFAEQKQFLSRAEALGIKP